ncbi:MAG: hypothetical protein P8N17_03970 [Luminiphilus sp.]|nr:hypothetical protein [Luminiphilus sp.]
MSSHKEQAPSTAVGEAPVESRKIREGNLIYLNATSRLVCQLDASRRQLDRLERHADRILRSVGAA